ncbi:MAG TPA: hypothetical protein VF516_17025, partial [Kofleriaceae bacterium]
RERRWRRGVRHARAPAVGRHTVVGVRGGMAIECLPGRLRLRGGSYWDQKRCSHVEVAMIPLSRYWQIALA